MASIEERHAEGLLEQMPYSRCVLIPVNEDGSLGSVAAKNMDFDTAMVAAWAFAVGVAQNLAKGDKSQVVADAMEHSVKQAKKRLYVAGGDMSAMRRSGQIGALPG